MTFACNACAACALAAVVAHGAHFATYQWQPADDVTYVEHTCIVATDQPRRFEAEGPQREGEHRVRVTTELIGTTNNAPTGSPGLFIMPTRTPPRFDTEGPHQEGQHRTADNGKQGASGGNVTVRPETARAFASVPTPRVITT